jgi:hypothetical protein
VGGCEAQAKGKLSRAEECQLMSQYSNIHHRHLVVAEAASSFCANIRQVDERRSVSRKMFLFRQKPRQELTTLHTQTH